jgi:L-asparaginase
MRVTKKHVRVILLGGTIASVENEKGVEEVVDLSEYVKTFYELGESVNITVNSFKQLSGYETRISDIVQTADEIKRAIREDSVDGIVVIMGTNVMEEFAFGINLLVRTDMPIVFTGAMRTPDMRGADGPGNLISGIRVAASDNCKDLGVLVVFNDEIHSADYVRKLHPQNPGAFGSEFPLGYVAEGTPSIRVKPVRRPLPWLDIKTDPVDVLLYSSYIGDTGKILGKVDGLGYSGIVVEGTGYGVVAEWVFDRLEQLIKKMPVVMASRIGNGDVMTCFYGNGYGMPAYLVEHGYLLAGQLDGRKARILLTFLLMSKCSEEEIRESFRRYSKFY